MILEIWSVTDRVYCNFGPFFCPFTPLTINKIKILKKKRKTLKILSFYTSLPKMPFVWCMVPEIRSITERTFCHFWASFCHFTSLTTRKIKISKKMKKIPGDIIILYKCTKNHDHMLYCCWDTVCDGCNVYFSFWAIFCPFTPLII